MIYYIVTNVNFPFDAANILQLINMVLNQPPRPPKSFNKKISNEFENLILMMLSKQPFGRNITHKDLKEAIRNTPIKLESQVKPIKKPVFKKEVWFRLLPNEKSKILQFLDNGGRINGIEYVANYLPRNRKTIAEILQRKTKFFFDPATNRLPYSTFSQTKGLVDLPYCWDKLNRLTHEDLRNISDIQKYVREVINWQASWNCDFFVAPFHFHRNLGDPWLELDLKLLQESVDYVKNNYSDIKIYAGICLNLEEYTSENNRIALLNEFSICTPDGFIFYGDEINETITNPARLYAYIELLRKFSVLGKKVIGARLGTLGLGILAAGADTVTTGIASLTGFSEKNLLQERSTGYNMEVKYYLPKLLLSLPSILVKDIIKVDVSLACNCEFCQGSPSLDSVAKIHYLNVRNNEVNEINSIRTNKEKLHWFADKIQNALAKCREVQKEIVELRPGYFSHLNTWLNVFGNYK